MSIAKENYKLVGMRQDDIIGTDKSPNYAYEIMNMRLNTLGDSTTGMWTTEKGTRDVPITWEKDRAVTDFYEEYTEEEITTITVEVTEFFEVGQINPLTGEEIVNGMEGEVVKDGIKGHYITYNKTITDSNLKLKKERWEGKDLLPIGQAVIDEKWIVFLIGEKQINGTDYKRDFIIKYIENGNGLTGKVLYADNLHFDKDHPLETIVSYETVHIQKVYWVDGLNQPRMINVAKMYDDYVGQVTTRFDFVREVQLKEDIFVQKLDTGGGLFPPGTVKYLFTYYNKYGQETNVVWETPLYYPTMGERACHPDEISGDVFAIDIYNLDINHDFDYMRVYSVIRTTENSIPILRKVTDIDLTTIDKNNNYIRIIDSNTTGEILDPSIVDYIGGVTISAETFDQKANTLFLGNLKLKTNHPKIDVKNIDLWFTEADGYGKQLRVRKEEGEEERFYDYRNQMNYFQQGTRTDYNNIWRGNLHDGSSMYLKHFKFGEKYRMGIQFQDKRGKWSEVIYIKDIKNDGTKGKPFIYNAYEPTVFFNEILCKIKDADRKALIADGYVKARLVCCFPNVVDRTVIAQGVINPTIYNKQWREDATPHVASSYFFRPNDFPDTYEDKNYGKYYLPWKHDTKIGRNFYGKERYYDNIEIQSCLSKDGEDAFYIDRSILTFHSPDLQFDEKLHTLPLEKPSMSIVGVVPIAGWASSMYVDADGPMMTFRGVKGNGFIKKDDLKVNHKAFVYKNENYIYEANTFISQHKYLPREDNVRCGSHTLSPGVWHDRLVYWDIGGGWLRPGIEYPFYPFQRNTQLNNWVQDIEEWHVYWQKSDDYEGVETSAVAALSISLAWAILNPATSPLWLTAAAALAAIGSVKKGDEMLEDVITSKGEAHLNTKVLSHLLYSETTYYRKNDSDYNIDDLNDFNIVNVPEVLPTKLELKTKGDKIYYANVNTIAPVNLKPEDDGTLFSTKIDGHHDNKAQTVEGNYWLERYLMGNKEYLQRTVTDCYPTSDPVPITYKSTIHGVFETESHLKSPDDRYSSWSNIKNGNLLKTDFGVPRQEPFLYLVDLMRDVKDENKFNGGFECVYIPCGPAFRLDGTNEADTNDGKQKLWYRFDSNGLIKALDSKGDLTLEGAEGDTYMMRYDNLKTYPFDLKDTNQIVEILSFLCESRINIDGRYDQNRGLTDNTLINNTNFNYVNLSYTQTNNLFKYTEIDETVSKTDNFPNQITWSKVKNAGAEIDVWTNITLASVADADGTVGAITKILNFNDNLLLFQEHGIAKISYNEKTAISTESGVPLELAKNNYFNGFDYIDDKIGCQNKWSISDTPNGVMFIDDLKKQMYNIGGKEEGKYPLSTMSGLDSYFIKTIPSVYTKWTPYGWHNFVTYYDMISKDIYYSTNGIWLAWNEVSNTFTSFYSYGHIPYMANLGKHFFFYITSDKIYGARENEEQHCKYLGNWQDFWITLVCDGKLNEGTAFDNDKVFNNIEFVADIFNKPDGTTGGMWGPIDLLMFNKIAAWNGYQMYKEWDIIEDRLLNDFQINSERKFNTWRVQMPRATYNMKEEADEDLRKRDRVRGHWAFVKLLNDDATNAFANTTQGKRAVVHDLAVTFDAK